jgi:hypothetical protein
MALIVLHRAGNSHEATLDQDVTHMGNHYGNVVHVLQAEIANYQFPNTDGEQTIHILTHGAVNHVCNMQATEFNAWMLKAFQMSKYPQAVQTYFIYSCDVATGGQNLLASLANYAAMSKVKNRTFLGTAGENGVVNTNPGAGKVLMKGVSGALQPLGSGWKGYRTSYEGKGVVSKKLPETEVNQIVCGVMNW